MSGIAFITTPSRDGSSSAFKIVYYEMQICVLDSVITHPESSEYSLSLLLSSLLGKAEARKEQAILSFKSLMIFQKNPFSQYIKTSPKFFFPVLKQTIL